MLKQWPKLYEIIMELFLVRKRTPQDLKTLNLKWQQYKLIYQY